MFPLVRPERRAARALARAHAGPLGLLRDEVDEMVDRFLTRWAIPEEFFRTVPAWEVTEAEKEVVYRMPLPGFEVNEIELSIVGTEMTVRAEHHPPEAESPERREERPFAHVELTVTLPAGLEPERMEARFRNGLLEVHIPRVPAAVPRRIEIKA
jgi:HSP20 family protein